ncbi:putative secreted protein [Streptomyces scabiei 87.22]|uniref:Putative secreted protein n=1 Tax=Streptomyces scabiei (strain 87.22) TaxID=680198 RepID=C9Z5J2_STRSW|nr:lamin tail domain-containing protein [Streptomyces scabiei]MDX2579386.1 lamin tail domain-containing protein [Streptomyces scabiei]MDX2653219.1 lamin tail domain-containing protein [Streptomyces scabiei]MDX2718977.1 lamin tail domain-containing protein [Streptomyces scabiei]MDX2864972.1 lamin tail domain-containing protein [Streptomyces scabiei]MDX2883679.1 lamin tail domain-containing protein [Streptomyces scabiei]
MSASASASVTARSLVAAALAAGAVVSMVTLPASAADHARPERSRVTISDVQYNSPGHDDGSNRSLNREWVEITNNARRSVNLDGWTLKNEDGKTYTFEDYRLEGRTTVRIHTGRGRDTDTDLYQDSRRYIWDNRDTATLRNDRGRYIDSDSWGHHHGGGHHNNGGGHHNNGGGHHNNGGGHHNNGGGHHNNNGGGRHH